MTAYHRPAERGIIILALVVVLLIVGGVVFLLSRKSPESPPQEQKPYNVLLVTLDTTRADRLGCYGNDQGLTPRMDQLAEEGVLFENAIAQASLTPISHASILTGLYPYQHGLRVLYGSTAYRLEKDQHPTLATVLQKHGLDTGAFVSAFPVSEYFGLDQGFDTFDTGLFGNLERKMEITETGQAKWDVNRNQRRADQTTGYALEWLKNRQAPFFLWLHYFDPHDTRVEPPKKFSAPYLRGLSPKVVQDNQTFNQQRRLKSYDAEVAYVDRQLGRIFDFLKEQGCYDNTVIVVTNDHGEGLGDHDWWSHRILYQEQLRMPLIVRLPEGPEKRTVPNLVRSIDIMPTILEALGITPPPMEGRSMLGLVRGEKEADRYAYADALIRLDGNRPQHCTGIYDDLIYAIVTPEWKLIHRQFNTDASELYRLSEDPGETRNVIDNFPEVRKSLLEKLQAPGIMIDKLIAPVMDNEAAERLKQLGY